MRWRNPTDAAVRWRVRDAGGEGLTFEVGPGESIDIPDHHDVGVPSYAPQLRPGEPPAQPARPPRRKIVTRDGTD